MFDLRGVHFPSDQVLAFQDDVQLVSQTTKSLQNSRNNTHSRHVSEDLRVKTLRRRFRPRERFQTSPCTFSTRTLNFCDGSQILPTSFNPHRQSNKELNKNLPSSNAAQISISSSISSTGPRLCTKDLSIPSSSSDPSLRVQSPVSCKSGSSRKKKSSRTTLSKSLSKYSAPICLEKRNEENPHLCTGSKGNPSRNEGIEISHKFHLGEGDTPGMIHSKGNLCDEEQSNRSQRNLLQKCHSNTNSLIDMPSQEERTNSKSRKILDFSRTHKCGICVLLEQQKQKFRSAKLEFSQDQQVNEDQLELHELSTRSNAKCDTCVKISKTRKANSPLKLLSSERTSRSHEIESPSKSPCGKVKTSPMKSEKSPLKKLLNKLRKD